MVHWAPLGLGVQHIVDGVQLGLEVLSVQVALLFHLLHGLAA